MTLPTDLVFVRHGESEGNVAKRRSEKGDNSVFTPEFMNRHSASFRLTPEGRRQAGKTGDWIRNEFPMGFDRYIVSEYIRAMETASLLNIPRAEWFCEPYLTERDWGELDICPEDERKAKFGEALRKRKVEPFFWRPPNGETFVQLCMRLDRVFHTLHRECSDKRVIIPCHGEVMLAGRVRIERISQIEFKRIFLSKRREDRIFNCQIIHYTRRDPETGKLSRFAEWVRMVGPSEQPVWDTGWKKIVRPRYSNKQLLQIVEKTRAMLK